VFLTSNRCKGQFIVEYAGELITSCEGNRRELEDPSVFRYFFSHKNKQYWLVRRDFRFVYIRMYDFYALFLLEFGKTQHFFSPGRPTSVDSLAGQLPGCASADATQPLVHLVICHYSLET